MRASAVSFAHKLTAATLAALLTFTLVPLAHADGEAWVDEEAGASPRRVVASSQGLEAPLALPDLGSTPASSSTEAADPSVILSEGAEGPGVEESNSKPLTLASGLVGTPSNFINSDVALDGDPIIGSFTVDSLTFAVIDDSHVELVGVSEAEADAGTLMFPETVAYEGSEYTPVSIASYAFYLSGVTDLTLPASVNDVDDRAFRSSDVSNVAVAEGNPTYSSFDGALYDAEHLSLLLIPEGKQGTVRIPKTAEVVDTSVFSHCPLVDSISVDAGSAAFASENGLLYTSDLTTLLRVPAGATEIAIREGCTTIAAGALEACANLERINAPTSVTSISPDIFHAIPTVSLPAASVILSGDSEAVEVEESNEGHASEAGAQITAMVALSSADDVAEMDPSSIIVMLDSGIGQSDWQLLGFNVAINGETLEEREGYPLSGFGKQSSFYAVSSIDVYGNGGTLRWQGKDYPRLNFKGDAYVAFSGANITYPDTTTVQNPGCSFRFWGTQPNATTGFTSHTITSGTGTYYAIWNVPLTWDADGGYWGDSESDVAARSSTHISNSAVTGYAGSTLPVRYGYRFTGWKSSEDGDVFAAGTNVEVLRKVTYTAQWVSDYTIRFDGNVLDDDAHPATVPDDIPAVRDEQVDLPEPTRFGYIFKGWATHPFGSTAGGHKVLAPGEKAVNLTDIPGDTVTLYALWALKYDADVPICSPSDMTFALDATGTGDVKAIPADYKGDYSPSDMEKLPSTHSAAIESRMAVPVAVESVSASAMEGDGFSKVLSSTDDSPADEQLSFTIASGDAKASVKAGESKALSNLMVPEASEATPVSKLSLAYGLELADTAVVLANDGKAAVPVAKVSYTLDIIDGMASKWGFFMLDGGTPVTPTRIKAAADDIAEADHAGGIASSGYYDAFRDALDARTPFYLRVDDQPDGGFSVHEMDLLGIAQDMLSTARKDGSGATIATKAGLTFGFRGIYSLGNINSTNSTSGGWNSSALRNRLRSTFMRLLDPVLQDSISPVSKNQQIFGGTSTSYLQPTTGETIWIPSTFEVYGNVFSLCNDSERYAKGSYSPFQYQAFSGNGGSATNPKAIRRYGTSTHFWYTRSASSNDALRVCGVDRAGANARTVASALNGVVPCFAV